MHSHSPFTFIIVNVSSNNKCSGGGSNWKVLLFFVHQGTLQKYNQPIQFVPILVNWNWLLWVEHCKNYGISHTHDTRLSLKIKCLLAKPLDFMIHGMSMSGKLIENLIVLFTFNILLRNRIAVQSVFVCMKMLTPIVHSQFLLIWWLQYYPLSIIAS